jgi:peptidoglycan/LPS O-acetylase OafA/YrhL
VLFVVSLASVVLLDGRLARLPIQLAGALLLFWLPLPAYVYLDRIGMFAPFFLLGALCGAFGARWERWMDRSWPWVMALFAGGLLLVAGLGPVYGAVQKCLLLVVGSISLPAIHGCLRNINLSWLQRVLLRLGGYSFMIYLFNTLFIGLAKALLLGFTSWDGPHFYGFAAVLMAAGLGGPMALKRYAFRRIKWLDRLTD